MTSTDNEKIIDIHGSPFIIPKNQVSDKSEMVKCEFYMLSDDLEFLIQNLKDDFIDWNMNLNKIYEDHEDIKKPPLMYFNECDCEDMMELFKRLYHYLKPFRKKSK